MNVRHAAVEAFTDMGPKAELAVPMLIKALNDSDEISDAAKALGGIGRKARKSIPVLVKELKQVKGYNRLNIAEALWKVSGDAKISVDALIQLLDDKFMPLQRDAAVALGKIGPPARPALPALRRLIAQNPEPGDWFFPQVRDAAEGAVKRITARQEKLAR